MSRLNQWLWEVFGDWIQDLLGLWVILTLALAVVLIVTIIIVAVRHAKNKKKIAALKAKAADSPDEAALRKQIREELEAEYKNSAVKSNAEGGDSEQIAELDETVKNQQARIKELKAQLEAAQQKDEAQDKSANASLYRTINELNKRVKAQEAEIARLKGESGADETTAAKSEIAAPQKQKQIEEEPEQEDDEDDYYDDEYGDESSAVKVTLKFDRIKNNWVILRSDSERTYRRVATKQEALTIAKDLARRLRAQLAVHKKDGKFQKV